MVFSSKGSSGYYQGMAVAVMFGLLFCTLLTLFFIPVAYSIVEERKEKKQKYENIESETLYVDKQAYLLLLHY